MFSRKSPALANELNGRKKDKSRMVSQDFWL